MGWTGTAGARMRGWLGRGLGLSRATKAAHRDKGRTRHGPARQREQPRAAPARPSRCWYTSRDTSRRHAKGEAGRPCDTCHQQRAALARNAKTAASLHGKLKRHNHSAPTRSFQAAMEGHASAAEWRQGAVERGGGRRCRARADGQVGGSKRRIQTGCHREGDSRGNGALPWRQGARTTFPRRAAA